MPNKCPSTLIYLIRSATFNILFALVWCLLDFKSLGEQPFCLMLIHGVFIAQHVTPIYIKLQLTTVRHPVVTGCDPNVLDRFLLFDLVNQLQSLVLGTWVWYIISYSPFTAHQSSQLQANCNWKLWHVFWFATLYNIQLMLCICQICCAFIVSTKVMCF